MTTKLYSIQVIGHSCYGAKYLKEKLNITTYASPFSWNTVYSLDIVNNIISNDFNEFVREDIFDDTTRKSGKNKYGLKFQHDYISDKWNSKNIVDKYKKRINRFNTILKKVDKVILLWSNDWYTLEHYNKGLLKKANEITYNKADNLEVFLRAKYKNKNIEVFILDDLDSHIRLSKKINDLKNNYISIEDNKSY